MESAASLLFMHGWATDSSVWDGSAKEIAGGRVYHALDLPGHGGVENWDSETLDPAGREIARVTNAAPKSNGTDTGSIIGIGWSLGGMALLSAAAKDPGLFKGLVLVSTGASFVTRPGFEFGTPRARVRMMVEGMRKSAEETLKGFYPLNFTTEEAKSAEAKDFISRYAPPGPVLCTEPGSGRPPGCYPTFDYTEITNALAALGAIDLRAEAKALKVPTLIIHGTEDLVCPIEAGRALHELLEKSTHSTMTRFTGAGHAPFITERDRFNRTVIDFIKTLER
ncbi:MAG: alpha/beta fold hydrolase [Proteobacteria bacterium]|nr:alpha/beta fold hydrolase [Pseudomonadota bacterium]